MHSPMLIDELLIRLVFLNFYVGIENLMMKNNHIC
jgi:hypothetical protein